MLHGVQLKKLKENRDERGTFTEVFREDWGLPIDARQWSLVESRAGTLRGMHVHARHDETVLVVRGSVFVGLYDLRPDSPTSGKSQMIELKASPAVHLVFPRGLVHGWYFPEDTIHLQGVSETYGEYGDDDNEGCHYGDPELKLEWPAEPRFVSDRAQNFPSVEELRERVYGLALA